jgi:hypothetical protein
MAQARYSHLNARSSMQGVWQRETGRLQSLHTLTMLSQLSLRLTMHQDNQ